MEICKAPSLRLKALNKHSVTHVMYIEMEMLSAITKNNNNKIEKLTRNAHTRIHTHTHTHTYIHTHTYTHTHTHTHTQTHTHTHTQTTTTTHVISSAHSNY